MASDLVAQLNTYMAAATAAVVVRDYQTAIDNALAAQGLIAAMPEVERSSGRAAGSRKVKWTQEGIDQFVRRVRQQLSASLGVQKVNKVYLPPGLNSGRGDDWDGEGHA